MARKRTEEAQEVKQKEGRKEETKEERNKDRKIALCVRRNISVQMAKN
jgi:hypothetical protein